MSDVLIKGINLPVGQGVISITIAKDKSVSLATIRRTGGVDEILCHAGQGKAVELPPHGRLIDADVLKKKMIDYGWKHPDSTVTEFIEDDIPTVLEASK